MRHPIAVALMLFSLSTGFAGAQANHGWHPPNTLDMVEFGDLIHTEMSSSERMAGMLELLREAMQTTGTSGYGGWVMAPGWAQTMVISIIGRHIPLEYIAQALEDEGDPKIGDNLRIAATLAGSEGFRDDLVRIASEHEMGAMRRFAVEALGGLEEPALEPVFREHLTDPYAGLALGGGLPPPVGPAPGPRKVYPVRRAAAEALARIGVTQVEAVTEQQVEHTTVPEMYAHLFAECVPEVCLKTAHILAREGGEEGLPHLRRFIEEAGDDPDLRDAVRVAELAPLTSAELVDALRDALAAGDRPVYQAAADILQARRDIGPVAAAWDDADPTMRRALAWIAGQLPGPEATELLVDAFFSEEEGALRREALDMLGRSPRSLQRQLTGPERAQLREIVLTGSLEDAAKVAMFAAPRIGSSVAERLRREVTEDPVQPDTPPERIWELNRMVVPLSMPHRRHLREYLEEAEGDWAMWVAIALGRVGEEVAGDTLKDALERERNPYVRYLLVRSLASALGEEAIPLLEELAEEETMARGSAFIAIRRHVETPIVSEAAQRELNRLRPR